MPEISRLILYNLDNCHYFEGASLHEGFWECIHRSPETRSFDKLSKAPIGASWIEAMGGSYNTESTISLCLILDECDVYVHTRYLVNAVIIWIHHRNGELGADRPLVILCCGLCRLDVLQEEGHGALALVPLRKEEEAPGRQTCMGPRHYLPSIPRKHTRKHRHRRIRGQRPFP